MAAADDLDIEALPASSTPIPIPKMKSDSTT